MRIASASTVGMLGVVMTKGAGALRISRGASLLMSSKKYQLSSSTNTAYKRVLTDEIKKKKLTLASDQVALDRMVDDYYVPVYLYFKRLLEQHRTNHRQPLFIGISAPQGCGKTTLTDFMRALFEAEGKSCLSVSIDDFYLMGHEQDTLATAHPTNPLLKFRGNAGSHDVQLMEKTLHALSGLNDSQAGGVVAVPQYDKSLREGRGDRTDWSKWLNITPPLDVVLLEGWMLGFTPVEVEGSPVGGVGGSKVGVGGDTTSGVLEKHPGMVEVNRQLRRYQQLHELFDAWLVIAVEDDVVAGSGQDGQCAQKQTDEMTSGPHKVVPGGASPTSPTKGAAGIDAVYQWRLQAETAMRAAGRPGLGDAQVADFIARFMPAYEVYLPVLYAQGPQRRDSGVPVLKVSGVGHGGGMVGAVWVGQYV